ncbi:hypothetical protein D3C73_1483280 [compost metagenome]
MLAGHQAEARLRRLQVRAHLQRVDVGHYAAERCGHHGVTQVTFGFMQRRLCLQIGGVLLEWPVQPSTQLG